METRKKMSRFAILTVFFNQENHVDGWFQSFERVYGLHEHQLLVADNGSNDSTLQKLRSWEQKAPKTIAVMANHQNLGFAVANNLLAKQVESEWLCLLNPDVTFDSDFLGPCRRTVEKCGGLASPALCHPQGKRTIYQTWSPFFDQNFYPFRRLVNRLLPRVGTRKVDWLIGAAWILQTATFRILGGLDERYFLYAEDMDFCRRLAELHLFRQILFHTRVFHPQPLWNSTKFLKICPSLKVYFENRPCRSYHRWLKFQHVLGTLPESDLKAFESAVS